MDTNYAKIEDGKIISAGARPRFFTDDGDLVDDETLRQLNYLPIHYVEPEFDSFYQYCNMRLDDEWIIHPTKVEVTYQVSDYDTDDIKARVLNNINNSAQATVAHFIETYPQFEIQSWYVQEKEARAYFEDNTVETPFCDTASAERGVPKELFITKVIEKADTFAQISAHVAGYRQRLEDEISTASRTELKDIVWDLSLED